MTGLIASLAARAAGHPAGTERVALRPRPLARFEPIAGLPSDEAPPALAADPFPAARQAPPPAAIVVEPVRHEAMQPPVDPPPPPAAATAMAKEVAPPPLPAAAASPRGAEVSTIAVVPEDRPERPSPASPRVVVTLPSAPGAPPPVASPTPMQTAAQDRRAGEPPGIRPIPAPSSLPADRPAVAAPQMPSPIVASQPPRRSDHPPTPASVTVTIGRVVIEQVQPLRPPAPPPAPARTRGFDDFAAQRRGRLR